MLPYYPFDKGLQACVVWLLRQQINQLVAVMPHGSSRIRRDTES